MRFFRNSWIGIGLAILFGASLFFFRGQARYSNLFNSDNFVADISGTPISTTKFMRSMDMNINQFSQMIGDKLTGDQIRSFQVHQIALQYLVNNAIFENEYDKHIAWYEDIETIYRNHFKKFIHVPWYRIKSRDFDLNVPEWVNRQYRHDYNCTMEEAITYMNMEGEPHGNHLSEHRQEQLLNGYILKNENLYNWLQQ